MNDHHPAPPVECPACGHPLSMFTEPPSTAPERVANRIAEVFGSWSFLVVLALATIAWLVANVVWRPLQPYPSAMVDYLGLALTVLASVQLPLILLSQRQDVRRDRERDRESLRVAANTEADLHALRQRMTGQSRVPPHGHTVDEPPDQL